MKFDTWTWTLNFKKTIGLLPLVILCVYYCWKAWGFAVHDFANYYFGAYAIANHFFNPETYDALAFNLQLKKEGFDFLFVSYYPNTPFLAFSFLPLTLFEWQTAKLLLNTFSSILFLFALYRLFVF